MESVNLRLPKLGGESKMGSSTVYSHRESRGKPPGPKWRVAVGPQVPSVLAGVSCPFLSYSQFF